MNPKTTYQSGFGNEFATEAVAGALPVGQNAPQDHPLGLYTEQFSGTPFTAPRAVNRRTWTYRIRPSVTHRPYEAMPMGLLRSGPFNETPTTPNQLRWDPLPLPEEKTDFVNGIVTLAGNGDPALQTGVAIHLYAADASMEDRFFANADGELLIVPQMGALRLHTELGILEAAPGEICVIPRGVKFRRRYPSSCWHERRGWCRLRSQVRYPSYCKSSCTDNHSNCKEQALSRWQHSSHRCQGSGCHRTRQRSRTECVLRRYQRSHAALRRHTRQRSLG